MKDTFDIELLYVAPDGAESVALIYLKGTGKTVCNLAGSNSYQIVSGEGVFFFPELGGKQVVEPGDMVHVPSGRVYYDEGDLVMLCTSRPAFKEDSVVVDPPVTVVE